MIEGWPPRWLTPVPEEDIARGSGQEIIDFGQTVCRVTKDGVAGKAGTLIRFRPWQKQLQQHVFARRPDGRLRHRTALVGMARKNGKSAGLGSPVALWSLMFGPEGGEVYSCAGDKEQARIVFGIAKRMVELDPDLSEHLRLYRDAIEFPMLGSVYRVLSREAFSKEGLNPHLVLFDELHVQPDRELWSVMDLATGGRVEPLILGITTAGNKYDRNNSDSLCYEMYQYGTQIARGEIEDDSFFMAWYEPMAGVKAPYKQEATWREGNPGYGDIVSAEDFEAKVKRVPENEFRTKRCNQWVSTDAAWMPQDKWEAIEDKRTVPEGTDVVLSFDGSFTGDSTGITVHSLEDRHIDVAHLWERPPMAKEWQVNQDEVESAIRECFNRWQVRVMVYDRRVWVQLFQRLADERYPVEEMPQGEAMAQAAQRFYEDVMKKDLSQSGDPALTRHIMNAVMKPLPTGYRIQKEAPNSKRHIDLAACAIQGHAFASRMKKKGALIY